VAVPFVAGLQYGIASNKYNSDPVAQYAALVGGPARKSIGRLVQFENTDYDAWTILPTPSHLASDTMKRFLGYKDQKGSKWIFTRTDSNTEPLVQRWDGMTFKFTTLSLPCTKCTNTGTGSKTVQDYEIFNIEVVEL